MDIKTEEIERIFKLLIEKLKEGGIENISVNQDYYLNISPSDLYKLDKISNVELNVGSLDDDWESLLKTINGENVFTYLDFDRIASILIAVSEEIIPTDDSV
jgi:hypothetical protein